VIKTLLFPYIGQSVHFTYPTSANDFGGFRLDGAEAETRMRWSEKLLAYEISSYISHPIALNRERVPSAIEKMSWKHLIFFDEHRGLMG